MTQVHKPLSPKTTLAMSRALQKIQAGTSVRQAANEENLWPQSVYLAMRREGIQSPGKRVTGAAARFKGAA